MRRVFLLTGFQNWGKTWLIERLFNRKRFRRDALYDFSGNSFCVMPQSNDDLGKAGYEDEYMKRIEMLSGVGIEANIIISAFCPTMEPRNNSADIVKSLYHKDKVTIIPIEYKWCNQARLQLEDVSERFSVLPNIEIDPILGRESTSKLSLLESIVCRHLNNSDN